jgi:uncharacterized protein (TIGR02996 family)
VSRSHPDFEQAIAANRDDVDAYLVYADWLAAQGDPRGELIVLQHRVMQSGDTDGKLMGAVARHFTRYPGLVPALDPWHARFMWKLGFVERIELDDPSAGELATALGHPSCRLARRLALNSRYERAGELLDELARETRPTLEALGYEQDGHEGVGTPPSPCDSLWAQLPNLQQLTVGGDRLFRGLEHARLRELDIVDNVPFDRDPVQHWRLPAVERVAVRAALEDPFEIEPIWHGHLPALRDLDLDCNVVAPPARCWLEDPAFLELATRLETLGMQSSALGTEEFEIVARLMAAAPQLRNLRMLVIHDSANLCADLAAAVGPSLPNLRNA